jgi:hypothetical protein
MFELAKHTSDVVMDLPPETFVGAMLLALVVAMATACVYRWMAQHKPSSLTPMICLIFLANVACIIATVYLVQSTVPTVRIVARRGRPPQDRIVNLHDHFSPPDAAGSKAPARPGTHQKPREERRSAPSSLEMRLGTSTSQSRVCDARPFAGRR